MKKKLSLGSIEHYNLFDYIFVFSVLLYSCLCCLLYAYSGNALIDTLIMILFLFTVSNTFIKYKIKYRFHSFEKWLSGLLFLVFIMYLFLTLLTDNTGFYMDYFRGGVICLLFILLGEDFRFTDKIFNLIIIWGAIAAIGVAFFFVFFNIGGVVIDSSYGRGIGKNAFGPMLCYVFTIMLLEIVRNKDFIFKAVATTLCIFSFIAISVLRARTSMVVCFFILLLFLYKRMRTNVSKFFLYIILFLFFISILDGVMGFSLINKATTFVSDAFTVGHEGDLTSHREERNNVAVQLIRENFLLGNIEIKSQMEWVHNYFLYVLSSWGILIGAPLLSIYIFLWIHVIRKLLTVPFDLNNIGYFLLLVPLITSLSESTFPFYPGTALFIPYFSLGFTLRNRFYSCNKNMR